MQSAKIIRQSRPETARGGSVRSSRLASGASLRPYTQVAYGIDVCIRLGSVRRSRLASGAS